MRGTKNLYKATAVVLFGQVIRHDLQVNNVFVARVYPAKHEPVVVKTGKTVRLNPALVKRAIEL